jgi:hypothetical protein
MVFVVVAYFSDVWIKEELSLIGYEASDEDSFFLKRNRDN